MFGITIEKLFVIVVFAALVIGPTRLPDYAQRVAEVVRSLRGFVRAARAQAEADMGVPLDAARWRQLDPRRALAEAFQDAPGADTGSSAHPRPVPATGPSAHPRPVPVTESSAHPRPVLVTGSSAHPRRALVTPTAAATAPELPVTEGPYEQTPEPPAAARQDDPTPEATPLRRGDPRGVRTRDQESWAS